MHFCPTGTKMIVATSFRTGVSNMPPACCTAKGSSPISEYHTKKKNHTFRCGFLFGTRILIGFKKKASKINGFLHSSNSTFLPYKVHRTLTNRTNHSLRSLFSAFLRKPKTSFMKKSFSPEKKSNKPKSRN